MNRRKVMKIAAGAIIGSGACILKLPAVFSQGSRPVERPGEPEYINSGSEWIYHPMDPAITAGSAYRNYITGSCMYATFRGVLAPLAEKYGEPYASFPFHMMEYGHGGIGGTGNICGTLNGAAAVTGLFVTDKKVLDKMIAGLFQWYKETELPVFKPEMAAFDFTPPASAPNSILCSESKINWAKAAGYEVNSGQAKERCRRLAGDVAARVTMQLNDYFSHNENTAKSGGII